MTSYVCYKELSPTANIKLLWLRPEQSPLDYQAGQYVKTKLEDGSYFLLSIANAKKANGEIEVHLRHDDKHLAAQVFLKKISQNPRIELEGPLGKMTLNAVNKFSKLCFLAGGTGIAPLKAVLEQALSQHKTCHLYWGVRRPEDNYEQELLDCWKQQFKTFSYTIVLSEPESHPDWQGPTGLVGDYFFSQINSPSNIPVLASGPWPMINAAFKQWQDKGLDPDLFISDMIN